MSEPGSVVAREGLPPDSTMVALTEAALDLLRAHLRRSVDRMLEAGWDGAEIVGVWRSHWGDILDSIAADAER